MKCWQEEWDATEKGRWTRALMPHVKYEELDEPTTFWLSQGLSGHGVFASFLYKYKRRNSPLCRCEAEEETPEHVLTQCPLYADGRPEALDVQ